MSMISRGLEQELLQSAGEMPVLTLTGPRQSGKTTLVRACFPDYEYVRERRCGGDYEAVLHARQ